MKNKNPEKEYKKIGEYIRAWRELKGLKQEDVAHKIGISTTALSNIETGVSKPNIERLEDIAEALEVELSQLLINPQQLFSTNNNNHNTQHNVSHQQAIDKNLVDRMMDVMEKMTAFFTAKKT